jgi:hypothetical protein
MGRDDYAALDGFDVALRTEGFDSQTGVEDESGSLEWDS